MVICPFRFLELCDVFAISAPFKMKKYRFWSCEEELKAMKHMVIAVSIYRIHKAVTLRKMQMPYQHHVCTCKDMRNRSNHEETGLPATSTTMEQSQGFRLP